MLSLEAMGIGAGDEVICPSFTFYATAEAIARAGATPVFADIDPETMNVDPQDVARRITERTRAIMPVHLFGRPAPLAALAALGLPLIEDAAQAFGAEGVARTGVCSTFSFFPTKNLFALGDGGLVACNDDAVAERVRKLRFHGSLDKKHFELVGTNSRLDAIQAAALRVFLPQLRGWNDGRREAAARYAELGLGEARASCRSTSPATSTTCSSCAPRARPHREGAARGGHLVGRVLHAADPPAAGDAPPRLAGRARCPRPSAPRPRTWPCRCGAASPSDVQERVVAAVRAAVGVAA